MRLLAAGRAKSGATGRESAFMERFGTFAECLLTGVWIAVAALPLVTAPAAFAAGARHLRRHLGHLDDLGQPGHPGHLGQESTGWRQFTADLRAALRTGWAVGLAAWAALGLLWLDLAAVRAGLPGGAFVGAVGIGALLGLVVAVLRAAARWMPGDSWRALLAVAARHTVLDPAGSFLLIGGIAVVAASAWFSLPLAAPVLGALAAAAVAVEERRRSH
ncbi:hypothetical protein U9R90_20835 [Streptomyces sp. E11-3]|uniref:hypothetical protein n=1 Tax=Streptomyces sp. E11-3 TaxID=3110112 RepID=UPI00398116AF